MDEKASYDVHIDTFFEVLSSAMNLTDQFSWPFDQYSFQAIHENVSVCIEVLISSLE